VTSDPPFGDDGPPTEEIYLELKQLESVARESDVDSATSGQSPMATDDDPTGIKARIERLRAVLSDRGVEPPS
jgi:hypothetical protein